MMRMEQGPVKSPGASPGRWEDELRDGVVERGLEVCGEFPSPKLFEQVCRCGLSTVRPLLPSAAASDQFGWNYGSARQPAYWAYGRLRALLTLRMAMALDPKRVLEVAAGDAALSACLARTGCEVVVNDLRRDHLESSVSQFENRDHIGILPGDVFELDPAITGQFDLVIACEIIEHVADAAGLLRQLGRFLTPNGRILLTTPNGSYFRNKLPTYSEITDFKALESRQFKPDADGHLYLITSDEMRKVAESVGLKVQRLSLWGTPFITGESGFRLLSPLSLPFYRLELGCQSLPISIQQRLANAMAVVLAPTH
jgi:2-polyprenyl-3-methyl-5-hydroxy-6-metoxy-1,4-benzoquinol methylase